VEPMSFGRLMLVCLTVVAVCAIGVTGCTYTVSNLNDKYYAAFDQCVQRGGTWVSRGTEGTCVNSK
jgi:cell division protein FtsL